MFSRGPGALAILANIKWRDIPTHGTSSVVRTALRLTLLSRKFLRVGARERSDGDGTRPEIRCDLKFVFNGLTNPQVIESETASYHFV